MPSARSGELLRSPRVRGSTASIVTTSSVRDVGRHDALAVEVGLEDLERGRRGGGAAVAPVFDHGADDDRRAVEGAVAAPPGLVELQRMLVAGDGDELLRRPRLTCDRDRELPE